MTESIRGMVRRDDPDTSSAAAKTIARRLNKLHQSVIQALKDHGPLTDEQLERLPQFAGLGPSTVRKRRSELCAAGMIVNIGEKKNSRGREMIVWYFPQPRDELVVDGGQP